MNIRDLRYILAVARHRHFGRAAEACHVSQPTLSVQIRKLEAELGVQLFERQTAQVLPTAAGQAVLVEAQRALEHIDQITSIARRFHDPLSGPLALGVIATLGPSLVAPLMARVTVAAPRLVLSIQEDTTDRLLSALAAGDLDAAVVATEVDDTGLACEALFEEPFFVAMAPNHPLAAAEAMTVEDLVAAPLLLLSEGHCLGDQTLALCQRPRSAMTATLSAASLETAMAAVGMGQGVTLVPALHAPRCQDLHLRPAKDLSDAAPAHRIVRLVHRRGAARQPAGALIAGVLRDLARQAGLRVIGQPPQAPATAG